MPKASGKHWDEKRESKILTGEESITLEAEPPPTPQPPVQTKSEAIKSLGFDNKQAERFQTLAQHKDIVEQVKQEARANVARLLNNGKYMKTRGLDSKHVGDVDFLLTL